MKSFKFKECIYNVHCTTLYTLYVVFILKNYQENLNFPQNIVEERISGFVKELTGLFLLSKYFQTNV